MGFVGCDCLFGVLDCFEEVLYFLFDDFGIFGAEVELGGFEGLDFVFEGLYVFVEGVELGGDVFVFGLEVFKDLGVGFVGVFLFCFCELLDGVLVF